MSRISTKPPGPFAPVSSKVNLLFSCNRVLGQPGHGKREKFGLLASLRSEKPKDSQTNRYVARRYT